MMRVEALPVSYRVLTVAREFGSGGAKIANLVAGRLGWTLLDSALIDQIAREAHVDLKVARECDERVDSWFHRVNKSAVIAAMLSAGLPMGPTDVFDSEAMATFSTDLIEKAYAMGGCVIVGRGGQCVLRGRPRAFHVFVYASRERRVERLRPRYPNRSDLADIMAAFDAERARYNEQYFGQPWDARNLYDLMLSSDPGEEWAAGLIVAAMHSQAERSEQSGVG